MDVLLVHQLFSLVLHHDQDVVTARQRAAQIAGLLGFDPSDRTRIATAVSEIVRNAFRYAHDGRVSFHVDDSEPPTFVIDVRDSGPGIPHLADVLDGRYRSATGMGIGIAGVRRLMDVFEITSAPAGTSVVLGRRVPATAGPLTPERVRQVAAAIRERRPGSLAEEFEQQNQELLRALEELQRRQEEHNRLSRELEDTNRGVVALYAELDERADHLRRSDELKSRFLSNMTHEFRTPVNSIIGLCNLMIDDCARASREPEQELLYIRKAADHLSELVNDLLDLAKVEAGKTDVHPSDVDVQKLFGALRGMLRPLLRNESVALVFDAEEDLPALYTDEAKLSQILRNLISNALKFTEQGEVRVTARRKRDDRVSFSVSDTGIGIASDDQQRIFEEFTQVEHRLQRGVKGTGLGLALSKRLAELLGGSVTVQSEVGRGSTFTVTLPVRYRPVQPQAAHPAAPRDTPESGRPAAPAAHGTASGEQARGDMPLRVLIIDDEEVSRYLLRQCLPGAAIEFDEAATGLDGERAALQDLPDVILLDLALPDIDGREVLRRLRSQARTAQIPVVIVTATPLEPGEERALLEQASAVLSKRDLTRDLLGDTVRTALARRWPPVRTPL